MHEWITSHSQGFSLKKAVQKAFRALEDADVPDWAVLVPFSFWALRSDNAALVCHALVESDNGTRGIPIADALLADPYIPSGKQRRILFPQYLAISALYAEKYKGQIKHEQWCALFEKQRARGAWSVRKVQKHVDWDRGRVAQFLGEPVNSDATYGYTLVDFDLEPSAPYSSDGNETLRAVAMWLAEDPEKLIGTGRRKVEFKRYDDYSVPGKTSSQWVRRLRDLAWVPDGDGVPRRPSEVLPRRDATREEAPVASLSKRLIEILESEGIRFGVSVPRAQPLLRLQRVGSKLDAKDLASLLREARKQIETEADRSSFEHVVLQLSIPLVGKRRFPIQRIVRTVGGANRDDLGWVADLSDCEEKLRGELLHRDFPFQIPETTTGTQALGYLKDVWDKARKSPAKLDRDVRRTMPIAYDYCICGLDSDGFASDWAFAVGNAVVCTDGTWIPPTDPGRPVYFDDLNDRRFLPRETDIHIADSEYLGATFARRQRAADALGLTPLSSAVKITWPDPCLLPTPQEWQPRFQRMCELLSNVDGNSGREGTEDGDSGLLHGDLAIQRVERLSPDISIHGGRAECVPIDARLRTRELSVCGEPLNFGSDAAKELLRASGLSARDLATDVTALFCAIDSSSAFRTAAQKFIRAHTPDAAMPPEDRAEPTFPPKDESTPAVPSGHKTAPAPPSAAGTRSADGGAV